MAWIIGTEFLCLCLCFLAAFIILWLESWKRSFRRRPPGPPGWPVIGNMLDLRELAHQSLYNLQAKYGPVIWLKLGTVNTLFIQSAEAASELLKKQDHIFCDRKIPDSLTACGYSEGSFAMAKYGAYLRTARRLTSSELLVNKRILDTGPIREKCVDNMIQWIKEEVDESRSVGKSGDIELIQFIFLMTFNVIGNIMLSRDLVDPKSLTGREFFEAMDKFIAWDGKPNVADFFPMLRWLDPQGIRRNTGKYLKQLIGITSGFVKERIQEKESGKERPIKDFLDALLEYQGDGKEGPDKFSEKQVVIIILEMFFGGTETTSNSIQWIMTELLRNPGCMKKLEEELYCLGGSSEKIDESAINEMPYLQAVVKEAVRLHPVVPLLLPRNSIQDTKFMGYNIPKDTQVFVNTWAIHRDPDSWEDPLVFKPERFMGSNIDYKGQNFEFIPFGSGRRSCLGVNLSHKMLNLAVANLIHSFKWELPDGVKPETLDMREQMGISVRKLIPLKAIPIPRAR